LIKLTIHQKKITIVNTDVPNVAPNFIKEILLDIKAQINPNTRIVSDINIPLLPIERSSRQKNQHKTSELNDIIDQINLSDIYRMLHTIAAQYTFSQ
jgi:hypothetical protein